MPGSLLLCLVALHLNFIEFARLKGTLVLRLHYNSVYKLKFLKSSINSDVLVSENLASPGSWNLGLRSVLFWPPPIDRRFTLCHWLQKHSRWNAHKFPLSAEYISWRNRGFINKSVAGIPWKCVMIFGVFSMVALMSVMRWRRLFNHLV